ncbi:MAG: cysteine desulfurase family protein [Planctomycetota bacterium]|jgi:cysteine desulfurase
MSIYLDNHATTPVDPRVLEAMLPYFREMFGNAASRSHRYGWEAEGAVDRGRRQVAAMLGADEREIVFTSGATESNNLALKSAAAARAGLGKHILVSPIEHHSVMETLEHLAHSGFEVEVLPVDAHGRVRVEDVAAAVNDRTILISVMLANNEVGTIQPLNEIGALAAERGIWLHSDVTQGVGKIPFNVRAAGIHLASLTAHKIYGPKGCGALYVSRKDPFIQLTRRIHGGGQERGMRAGTLNVPGIVGLGKACELCSAEQEEEATQAALLRDRLEHRLRAGLEEIRVNGDPDHRLPGNLHVAFPGVDSQSLMMAVPEVAVSSGAACTSGSIEPSHVLKAMGVPAEQAGSSIRFGIGRFNTAAEIEDAAERLIGAVRKLRKPARR